VRNSKNSVCIVLYHVAAVLCSERRSVA